MANNNSTTTPPEIQSKTIEVSGRLFQIAKVTEYCWLLTDLATGEAKQFSEAPAMWRYIGAIKSFVPGLSLPQLPARCPQHPSEKRAEWKRNQIVLAQYGVHSCYSVDFPIYLPATTTPEPKLTRAQADARQDFLDQAERYFRLVTEVTHAKVGNYTRSNYEWQISNARLATGQAASRFVQFVSQGI